MKSCLIILILQTALFSFAANNVCSKEDLSKKIISINIGFNYADLVGTQNDILFYKKLAKNFTSNSKDINNFNKEVITKSGFLAQLKEAAQEADIINLNYAGHGIVNSHGEFSIVLPGDYSKCFKSEGQYRGLGRIDSRPQSIIAPLPPLSADCEKFLVSVKDLQSIFKGKKVFGFIDSCFSGAINVGDRSNVLYSSQSNQVSNGDGAGGAFTKYVQKVIEEKACKIDFDKDGQLSLEELTSEFPPVWLKLNESAGIQSSTAQGSQRGLGRQKQESEPVNLNQNVTQNPGSTGFGDWTKCIFMNSSNPRCASIRNYDVLDVVSQTGAKVFFNKDNKIDVVCILQKGDNVVVMNTVNDTAYVELPQRRGCARERGYVKLENFMKRTSAQNGSTTTEKQIQKTNSIK